MSFIYGNFINLCKLILIYPSTSLIIIAVTLFIYIYYLKQDHFKKYGVPHERPSLLFGNMMEPRFGSISFVERIKKYYCMDIISRYMGFYDFNNPIVLIRSPELIRQITVSCFSYFDNHRGSVNFINDPLYSSNLFSIGCNEKWRKIHYNFNEILSLKNIELMHELIVKCSKKFTNHMIKRVEMQSITINSKDAFERYTNDVIASCAFGVDIDSIEYPNNEFYQMAIKSLKFTGLKLLRLLFVTTLPNISKLFNINISNRNEWNFFYKIIRNTVIMRDINGITRPDIIQSMIKIRDSIKNKKSGFTIEDMVSQSFAFYSNGFDSTSSLMCFVAHLLSMNSSEQDKLQREVDDVYKQFNDEPTYDAIDNMKYLDAVINETLRLYPITPYIERICTRNVTLPPPLPGARSLCLKPGNSVWIPTYALQTDPTYFPFSKTFSPNRFIKNHDNIMSSFTYIPFGHGPRMCVGNKFAMLITKVLIYHLVAKCRLKRSDQMILPLELNPWSFSMSPKGGFQLDIESRWYGTID